MTMLNHQPFRDWLFAEEPLKEDEARMLQEHLRTCADCQRQRAAWGSVQHLFQVSEPVSPAAGFVGRWQERLVLQRQRRQHRLAWFFFFFSAGAAILSLLFLGLQVLEMFRSPQNLLLILFLRAVEWVTFLNLMRDTLYMLGNLAPGLSVMGLVLFTGFISLVSVLWLTAFKQLNSVRRIIE